MKKTIIAFTFAIALSAVGVGLVNVANAGTVDKQSCELWKKNGYTPQQAGICSVIGM